MRRRAEISIRSRDDYRRRYGADAASRGNDTRPSTRSNVRREKIATGRILMEIYNVLERK